MSSVADIRAKWRQLEAADSPVPSSSSPATAAAPPPPPSLSSSSSAFRPRVPGRPPTPPPKPDFLLNLAHHAQSLPRPRKSSDRNGVECRPADSEVAAVGGRSVTLPRSGSARRDESVPPVPAERPRGLVKSASAREGELGSVASSVNQLRHGAPERVRLQPTVGALKSRQATLDPKLLYTTTTASVGWVGHQRPDGTGLPPVKPRPSLGRTPILSEGAPSGTAKAEPIQNPFEDPADGYYDNHNKNSHNNKNDKDDCGDDDRTLAEQVEGECGQSGSPVADVPALPPRPSVAELSHLYSPHSIPAPSPPPPPSSSSLPSSSSSFTLFTAEPLTTSLPDLEFDKQWFAKGQYPPLVRSDSLYRPVSTAARWQVKQRQKTMALALLFRDLSGIVLSLSFDTSDPVGTLLVSQVHIPKPTPYPRAHLVGFQHSFGTRVVKFCYDNLGKKVGDGECWALANEALKSVPECMTSKARTHGHPVWESSTGAGSLADVMPGDIVEYDRVLINMNRRVIKVPSEHTSVVVDTDGRGWVRVMEQNVAGKKVVQISELDLACLASGRMVVYRPMPKEWVVTTQDMLDMV